MYGMFIAGMDVPTRDEWFHPKLVWGKVLGCAFEGWGCFSGRPFSIEGFGEGKRKTNGKFVPLLR